MDLATTYQQALLKDLGFDASLLDTPGVHVAADPSRAENNVTACYRLNEGQLFIGCPPAVVDTVRAGISGIDPTFEAWETRAAELGGELLGRARQQLLNEAGLDDAPVADGFTLQPLDSKDPDHISLIKRLIDVSDEDDLDDAEIELDKLDDLIEVVLDADGQIAAFASSRPFEMVPDIVGDIGIMTRADCRSKGLGSAAVAAVSQRLMADGIEPLYRCDEDNPGSVALSAGLGFAPVAKLSAFRFQPPSD